MFKDTNREKHKYTSKGAKCMGINFLHKLSVNKIIVSRAAGLSVFLVSFFFIFVNKSLFD